MLKASRQTTSSSATICNRVSTNSPFALYWLMVIMVLAGAVAVAMAPSISAKSQFKRNMNFRRKVTSTPAARASLMVITMILLPVRISTSFLKNFPTPKAMNASARSLIKLMPPIIFRGIKLSPQGPIRIPARIYPLTFGMFRVLVIRVMIKPEKRMMERVRSTLVSWFN